MEEPTELEAVSVDQALLMLSQGGVVIDIRSQAEYERGHAPGARLVDVREMAEDPRQAIWGDDPLAEFDKPVVITCNNGASSAIAAKLLTHAGLDARALEGGLIAWVRSGNPLIPGPPRR